MRNPPEQQVEKITPAIAKAWVTDPAVNTGNRTLRPDHVKFLAKEITEDRWEVTHNGVAFSKSGRLLDGQHRLHAIILANKAVDMFVARGLDENAFKVMDCGLKRANHDRIHLVNDYTQNHLVCVAIRNYLSETSIHGAISVGEIEDEFLKKDEAWTWIGAEACGMNAKLKKAGIIAALGIYRYVKPEKAAVFLDGFRSGVGLTEESPILRLRTMAMVSDHRDCNYWRVVSLMRAHLQGRTIAMVHPAAEDMVGNTNTSKTVEKRSERGHKAAQTRKKKLLEKKDGVPV